MKKKLLTATLGFFLAAAYSALGQGTISGTVIDKSSGDPLPGVNVVIDGTTRGSATGAGGEYQISNLEAGSYTLSAQFIGYEKQSREVMLAEDESLTVTFQLEMSAVNLNEVVVTGTGGPVEVRKLGNSIGRVGAEDLNAALIQNFSDVIQGRIPGLVEIGRASCRERV